MPVILMSSSVIYGIDLHPDPTPIAKDAKTKINKYRFIVSSLW
jgi:hypothetical protein